MGSVKLRVLIAIDAHFSSTPSNFGIFVHPKTQSFTHPIFLQTNIIIIFPWIFHGLRKNVLILWLPILLAKRLSMRRGL